MSRPLVPGLVAEGETDEIFLGILIFRQLQQLTWASARCAVNVAPSEIASCRSIRDEDRVIEALSDLAGECHLLFVHNDYRERRKVEAVRQATGLPVVGVVPVRETEAWLLADRKVWMGFKGSDLRLLPANPRDVERIADPKQVLDRVVPRQNQHVRDYFESIGRNIDLDVLAQVPAYAAWVAETESALKGLGYL
ncbi:DUF4276 family protein [Nonomuraea sp. MCN248]|uniref:DUF4276 family protein n=1 Tax=Nonomuraea corallina TaxID=2989783 RepID=A0ABT4SLF4_9ACTN|nr:DUF4276 family protein [Nonomuraea corallina]MDA0638064.1 DUF4276 family protein [Nonomuraea corallina]